VHPALNLTADNLSWSLIGRCWLFVDRRASIELPHWT